MAIDSVLTKKPKVESSAIKEMKEKARSMLNNTSIWIQYPYFYSNYDYIVTIYTYICEWQIVQTDHSYEYEILYIVDLYAFILFKRMRRRKERYRYHTGFRRNRIAGWGERSHDHDFEANGIKTDTTKNEYVAFSNGVYMQIVDKGIVTDKPENDSIKNNIIVAVRFVEHDI